MDTTPEPRSLEWLLDRFVNDCAHVQYAVALTDDGLLLGRSGGIDNDAAEKFAALASSLVSGSRVIGSNFGGGEHLQTTVELAHAYVMLTAAADHAGLVVMASHAANLGTIAYEVQQMIRKVGPALSIAHRELRPTAAQPS